MQPPCVGSEVSVTFLNALKIKFKEKPWSYAIQNYNNHLNCTKLDNYLFQLSNSPFKNWLNQADLLCKIMKELVILEEMEVHGVQVSTDRWQLNIENFNICISPPVGCHEICQCKFLKEKAA
jgi:hypothetical protein